MGVLLVAPLAERGRSGRLGFGRQRRRVPSVLFAGAWRLRVARSMASSIERRIDPASALFRPAMSKAVPWSGLVRTIGSPSVMLTALSQPSSFTGIRPWSWHIAIGVARLSLACC